MDFTKIQTLMLAVLGLVIIAAAIRLGAGAKKAQYSESARVGFNVLIAIVIAAIGLGAIVVPTFGGKILDTIGVTNSGPAKPTTEPTK
jgi:hypothetical protein